MTFDVVIVGAGLSGAVIAEQYASRTEKKILVIDKRDHIGGNCYDYYNEHGLLVNKYGVHAFHTNDEGVWNYIQKHAEWRRWDLKVAASVDDALVPVPVNMNTINAICGTHLQTSEETQEYLDTVQIPIPGSGSGSISPISVGSSEDVARSRVGDALYAKLFKNYTKKQWDKDPCELDGSVLARIPVRTSTDDRYFTDRYQALPVHGYTRFVATLLDHPRITVRLNTEWSEWARARAHTHNKEYEHAVLIFTGPIDHYYSDRGHARLEYRSLNFIVEHHPCRFYQPYTSVNYPSLTVPYTRIIDYAHVYWNASRQQETPFTTIVKEISTSDGEPYYPVPCRRNIELYDMYKTMAENDYPKVHFLGRLATYKYINMDQAIRNALDYFEAHLLCSE